MPSFVDTNVFIHYLLAYDPDRFEPCRDLLRDAEEGRADLETSAMVVAELVWFLARPPIRLPPGEIRTRIEALLTLRGLRVSDKGLILAALELYATTQVSYVDAYNAALMRRRGIGRAYSYDTDFDRVPGLTRVEP